MKLSQLEKVLKLCVFYWFDLGIIPSYFTLKYNISGLVIVVLEWPDTTYCSLYIDDEYDGVVEFEYLKSLIIVYYH